MIRTLLIVKYVGYSSRVNSSRKCVFHKMNSRRALAFSVWQVNQFAGLNTEQYKPPPIQQNQCLKNHYKLN